MIRAMLIHEGESVLLIGLSRRNCHSLQAGLTLDCDIEEMHKVSGITDIPKRLWLVAGETEDEIVEVLREAVPIEKVEIIDRRTTS